MKGRQTSKHGDRGVPLVTFQEPTARSLRPLPGAFSDVEGPEPDHSPPDSELDQAFKRWCQHLALTTDLQEAWDVDINELKTLYQRDTAFSRVPCIRAHWFRPHSVLFTPERLWLALSMPTAWASQASSQGPCCDPRRWVWVKGIAMPMATSKGYALKLLMSHFWQGGVAGFKLTLHAILLISLGIQLQKVIHQRPGEIWSTLHNGDSETWKRLIYDATGTSARLFWPLIFAPTLVMALIQMILQTTRTMSRGRGRLVHLAAELLQHLDAPSLWSSWIRPHLPLDPTCFRLQALADQLAFDGRQSLTPAYRQTAIRYFIMAVRHTRGMHRLLATRLLSKLSVGTHIHNLAHDRSKPASTSLSHLIVRMHANQTLATLTQTKPNSKEDRLYQAWARYHSWMAGQKTHPARIGVYLAMHVGLTAYFFYGFKVIIDAIIAYLDCPDKTGVSMTGVASWSDDYTQPCFNTYLTFFRQIPGQPIAFLLDIISRVHFTQHVIELDLSYKGVNASEIMWVLDALLDQGVQVSVLDLTGNTLATAQDFNTLMPALARMPAFQTLILHDVGLESEATPGANATGTQALARHLTTLHQLTTLSVRSVWLGYRSYRGIEALAQALPACLKLEQLTLATELLAQTSVKGAIALAHALPLMPALRQLHVSGLTMDDDLALAFVSCFAELKPLTHLTMRALYNVGSANATTAFLRGLASMQALEHLDFTGSTVGTGGTQNHIIFGSEVLTALSYALEHLPNLRVLKLRDTQLGYNDTAGGLVFARGLLNHTPLEVLDLGANRFTKEAANALDAVLTQWGLDTMPIQLRDADEASAYLKSLPANQTHLELDDGPQNDDSLSALFQSLSESSIQELNIRGLSFSPRAKAWHGLQNCTQLRQLHITFNIDEIISPLLESSWLVFLEALASLKRLEVLSLKGSLMLWYGVDPMLLAHTFAKSMGHLRDLRRVELNEMELGLHQNATSTILDALAQRPHLESLNVTLNLFGARSNSASQTLFSKLKDFPRLASLDISENQVGEAASVALLTDFLNSVERPFSLRADHTSLGSEPQHAQAFMIAIANNPHVSASLLAAGFGSQLWPPQVARLASATYDPYLRAACSNLQCFGIQPTLPDLGNNTRINFEQKHTPPWTAGPLFVIALLAMALCLGITYLFAFRRRYTPLTRCQPVASASIRPSPCPVSTTSRPQAPHQHEKAWRPGEMK